MDKKEFTVKSYSRQMMPLCTLGGIAAAAGNIVPYMVSEKYRSLAVVLVYALVAVTAALIYSVRNSYDGKICKKHRVYALISGIMAMVIAGLKILRPEWIYIQLHSWRGNPIDANVFATFVLIALIGTPMLDIVDTARYIQPRDTHIPQDKE